MLKKTGFSSYGARHPDNKTKQGNALFTPGSRQLYLIFFDQFALFGPVHTIKEVKHG